MTWVDADEADRRLDALARRLEETGALRDPAWRRAFRGVHRHVFVPRYWHDDDPGSDPPRWRMVDGATADHAEWLDAVYSDRTLPTELTGVPARGGRGRHPVVTSSSTMPGLVMAMLEALDVRDDTTVLEVGTGSGYSAALLGARLGDERVTTIDVTREVVALAALRLAEHGHRPHLAVGDGALGVPERAPFDRIIATCGVESLPAAWIAQTRDGGRILANLLGPFEPYALVLLTVRDGVASGRFLPQSGRFMPLRPEREALRDATEEPTGAPTCSGGGDRSSTRLDPARLDVDHGWGLLTQIRIPGATVLRPTAGRPWMLVDADGRSRAVVGAVDDDGRRPVTQSGPRRLWDEVEAQHGWWVDHGRPPVHRLWITIGPSVGVRLRGS